MKTLPETLITEDGPTVVGAGPDLLRRLLTELERELAAQAVPVDLLLPGVDGGEVRRSLQKAGRDAPDEIVVWFEWHNGVRPDADGDYVHVLPRFDLWSLRTVVETEPDLPYGKEDWEWDPDWVQLAGDHNGLIYKGKRDPALPALIRAMDPIATAAHNAQQQAVSLCTPVTWWIDELRKGWIRWDSSLNHWDKSRWAEIPLERRLTSLV